MQPSRDRHKMLFPETVVLFSGNYRVHHSTGHRPDSTTYLEAGLILPLCGEQGCMVSFELIFETTDCFELKRFKAAS